jgi:hypothetical protein
MFCPITYVVLLSNIADFTRSSEAQFFFDSGHTITISKMFHQRALNLKVGHIGVSSRVMIHKLLEFSSKIGTATDTLLPDRRSRLQSGLGHVGSKYFGLNLVVKTPITHVHNYLFEFGHWFGRLFSRFLRKCS